MIRSKFIIMLLGLAALIHAGCVQYGSGTIGDGQVSPEEQQALEQIVDIVQDIIEERQQEEPAPVEPPVVDDPAEPVPGPVEPAPGPEPAAVKENGSYLGRYNGDRPTWYFSKLMNQYPAKLSFTVKGCVSNMAVQNNGHRWETAQGLVKQSDVPGRGMALVMPASCKSKTAWVEY